MCSGRVTWDLMVERAKREDSERFAIARVEQLYPRPIDDIEREIARYPNLKRVRWVQDEPANMGPWPHYALNVWPQVDARVEADHPRRSPPRRRSAPSSGTRRSRRTCSTARSPEARRPDHVLHRPRDRGARPAPG